MNTQDNKKLIKAINKYTIHNYVEKLTNSPMTKIKLFSCFPQTGNINLSESKDFLLLSSLEQMTQLDCGQANN